MLHTKQAICLHCEIFFPCGYAPHSNPLPMGEGLGMRAKRGQHDNPAKTHVRPGAPR